jgi:hypothetical protein
MWSHYEADSYGKLPDTLMCKYRSWHHHGSYAACGLIDKDCFKIKDDIETAMELGATFTEAINCIYNTYPIYISSVYGDLVFKFQYMYNILYMATLAWTKIRLRLKI